MSWLLAILLLAISKTAVSQCDYIYTAEPPAGQLICDPFPINRLQLVCSVFVANFRGADVLTIRWFFSAPVNSQFSPTNAVLLREVSFSVAQQETITSRIVVSQFITYNNCCFQDIYATLVDHYIVCLCR